MKNRAHTTFSTRSIYVQHEKSFVKEHYNANNSDYNAHYCNPK